jgi:hypothetical protein
VCGSRCSLLCTTARTHTTDLGLFQGRINGQDFAKTFAEISALLGPSDLLELRKVSKAIGAKVESAVKLLRQDAEGALMT